jgi:hypothetical protein
MNYSRQERNTGYKKETDVGRNSAEKNKKRN